LLHPWFYPFRRTSRYDCQQNYGSTLQHSHGDTLGTLFWKISRRPSQLPRWEKWRPRSASSLGVKNVSTV
jgi:hypothetical protein